jgi:hypothetical protein
LELGMRENNRFWRVLLIATLLLGGLVVLSVVFALLGWWQVLFE